MKFEETTNRLLKNIKMLKEEIHINAQENYSSIRHSNLIEDIKEIRNKITQKLESEKMFIDYIKNYPINNIKLQIDLENSIKKLEGAEK